MGNLWSEITAWLFRIAVRNPGLPFWASGAHSSLVLAGVTYNGVLYVWDGKNGVGLLPSFFKQMFKFIAFYGNNRCSEGLSKMLSCYLNLSLLLRERTRLNSSKLPRHFNCSIAKLVGVGCSSIRAQFMSTRTSANLGSSSHPSRLPRTSGFCPVAQSRSSADAPYHSL